MKRKKNNLIGGALILGAGAFITKLLGAIYRIPLTNMLGSVGLGLYQMVFPVYSLLLDFSGASVPSALSKLIAGSNEREKGATNYLKSSLLLLFILGSLGTLLMGLFSSLISRFQGNPDANFAYVSLAPSVLLVCLISCFRGYFQGFMDMKPTAVSQILEQVIKLIFGLILVKIFLPDIKRAVAGATFAITISEIIALIYLFFVYKIRKNKQKLQIKKGIDGFSFYAKNIIKTTIPLTLIGITLPISHVIDTFLTVNLISGYRTDATALFGIFSGAVITVIHLPVSVCYGLSAVSIPAISSAKDENEQKIKAKKVLLLTFFASLICFLGCLIFAPLIVNLLFHSLKADEKILTVKLLRMASPCIVLLSMVQTSNAVLVGKGKTYLPVFSLFIGVMVKTILSVVLLKNPNVNIYGAPISLIACYFTVCLVNLIGRKNIKVKDVKSRDCNRRYAN